MNKKQLIVAAIATIMSVSGAHAVSDISGIANGNSGSFDITPEKVNSDVGYRYYNNFNLGQGDVANLIYKYLQSDGSNRDLNTFINLVNNQIEIYGLLNALKNDGTGHAVFISPNGMVVGASGVLNVGTLSVVTPTVEKFGTMSSEYQIGDFSTINNISALRNNTAVNNNNHGGNAHVDIQGKILARNGIDIRGSQVDISGTIINGYKGVNVFNTADQANSIFSQLVNTEGLVIANADQIANNDGRIVIKSGADVSESNKGGINIQTTGHIVNLNDTETAITNHGSNGLIVNGKINANDGKLNVYNNTNANKLIVNGKLSNKKADLSLTSKGGIDIKASTKITTDGNLEVVNKSGALNFAGTAVSKGKTDVVNYGTNTTISANLGDENTTTIRIVNDNGKLAFTGKAKAKDSVSLRNSGTDGMEISGDIYTKSILVHNKNGGLTTTVTSELIGNGNVAIKNEVGDMLLSGEISNQNGLVNGKKGETAINNTATAGSMKVEGKITNNGNMSIINNGNDETNVGVNAVITNTGKLKVANVNGTAFNVDGKINNQNGNVSVSNHKGDFTINGEVTNSNGYLFIYSRDNSAGLTIDENSLIKNNNGDLAIKHNGTGENAMCNGLDLKGRLEKTGTGELAINNYNGDMQIGGIITTDSKTGIANRNGAGDMTVQATITSTGNKELRIKNEAGTGDINVGGTINHDGRLNILNNDGKLTLDGTINNYGTDITYAISRDQADGIDVTSNFNANSSDGMIYILNKVGNEGLNYAGNAKSTNGQVEIYNKTGDMTVTGSMGGHPTVILNTGDNLTVYDVANLTSDVKIVNKGSQYANVADKYKNNFKEQLK